MPNRIIKESICSSDTIDKLSWFEEVFFYRLIVNCDDFGRFDARTSILKARLFPLRNISDDEIVQALAKLQEVGLLQLYEFEGRPYLQLTTWANHQTIRNRKSKFPSIEDANTILEYNCNQLHSNVTVIQSNPNQSNPIQYINNIGVDEEKPKVNVEIKKKKAEEIPIDKQIEEFTTDKEYRSILNQFVNMRKKIKKPLTSYAFKLILKKLVNISKDIEVQKDVINQSIVNSWQDVYPLKQNYQKQIVKQAVVPNWYDDYKKQLESIPKKEEELTNEEIDKIMNEIDKVL